MLYSKKIPIIIAVIVLSIYMLNFIGIVDINLTKLIALFLVFGGFSLVLIFVGTENKLKLFLSAEAFSIGFILLLYDLFLFADTSSSILTAVLFILSAGSLILFLDDSQKKVFLYISIILCILGSILVLVNRKVTLNLLYSSFISVLAEYWVIIGLLFLMFLYLIMRKR